MRLTTADIIAIIRAGNAVLISPDGSVLITSLKFPPGGPRPASAPRPANAAAGRSPDASGRAGAAETRRAAHGL